ncbi:MULTISPECIES: glyoxylate/hydroxypyruvate reductase GhrB [Tatumella]|uniref:Glyoxylate/hydroxypyruvate reductase GhrB n=1 Tax=Tatumella punctata TaxID=399969 RepID=A0ABW1VNX9_9GAMM|nr:MULTISPECIES: glyoxylate/hydroxypyruvate reductase GhrB [unclassified Tatumella]MBS0855633.1 glyoxylate/hydroxypyruvate reductase GhrB [Tatumella sp. JGM16]MBS0876614.1 glyoxylate/hydroxypyruvate reductase GhrB [Tatumella sp. JGM82]MBS0889999.1 glyoxylate/hydroxypyruvate reductase GhrB [Tatumella sp. JGM94]MBS0893138.1 glyoxylate/hydroxypyruvate reductase GhrB [Tatumella sp. JGM130]MBS0901243.1 glyoxylate/hydroxypyruvate reductase GhrB [Tatumella sp. JGM100]
MKPSVILYEPLPADLRSQLEARYQVTEVSNLDSHTIASHAAAFSEAVGLLGSGSKVDQALLEQMPALRACSTISVGYDLFDLDALDARRIALMHTPTVLTETVADTVFALILASARRVTELDSWVKAGEWKKSIGPEHFSIDVHHKTLGIVGMGRIGMAVAQRAHYGFGMNILYNARKHHPQAESRFSAKYCDINQLLEQSDFVCVILPLTEQTRHLIGEEQLSRMKPSAILINAGRGPVVDEQALTRALKNHTLYAAGLDVFEQEPVPANAELLSLPNVVTLPHVGSATHETRYGMKRDAVENLIAALDGKLEKNCVNPQAVNPA